MPDFTKYSNFNKDANLMGVKIGAKSPIMETEFNEMQDIQNEARADIVRDSMPSGFTKLGDIDYSYMGSNPNQVKMLTDSIAYVNGYRITIPAGTIITMSNPPVDVSRDDLVFLEVWKEEVSRTSTLTKYGQDGGTAITNHLGDDRVAVPETARRIALRWRLRTVDNVDFSKVFGTEVSFDAGYIGWDSTTSFSKVIAQGALASVPNYTTISDGSEVFRRANYVVGWNPRKFDDMGLWVAGKSIASQFNTIDGYVYAIPMFKVHRRASTGYHQTGEYSKFSPLISPIYTQRIVDGAQVSHAMDGSVQTTVNGNTLVNLLGTDGNFEYDSNGDNIPDGWQTIGNDTYARTLDASDRLFGRYSCKIVNNGVTMFPVGISYKLSPKIIDGHKYFVSTYAKTTGKDLLIKLGVNDSASSSMAQILLTKDTGWQRKSILFLYTASNGIYYFSIENSNGTGTISTCWIDGVMLYDLTAIYGAGSEPSDINQLERELPFIDGVQSSKVVGIKATGKNLFDKDGAQWQMQPNATDVVATVTASGIKIKNTVSGSYKGATIRYTLKPNTSYKLAYSYTINSGSCNVAYLDPYTNAVLGSGSTGSLDITVPNHGTILLRFCSSGAIGATGDVDYTNIQLEEGTTATTVQSYKASQLLLPNSVFSDLKKIGIVSDKVDLVAKTHTKNISDWLALDGSLAWQNSGTFTGYKQLTLPQSTIGNTLPTNSTLTVIKYNGVPLTSNVGLGTSAKDFTYFGVTALSITVDNNDSGWTDSYTAPTQGEVKAYFYGWKMCMSDGGTWDGVATKYWKKITDGTGITATLPTSSYAGYTPYKMIYQLATPVVTDISDKLKGDIYVNPELTTFVTEQVSSMVVQPIGTANMVTNGDFSNGTTGWTTSSATLTASNNEGTMLASAQNGNISQTLTPSTITGHKYYVQAKAKTLSSSICLSSGSTTKYHTGSGNYETLSVLYSAVNTTHGCAISDGRTSGWDNVYVKQLFAVDLTAMFGSGNEPSQAWCDQYLAFGTNYIAKSPTGTTALGAQRDNKDAFVGAQGNCVVIPANKYKAGTYEVFYKEAPETHVPPVTSIIVGAQTVSIDKCASVGSATLGTTDVAYKKTGDGANTRITLAYNIATPYGTTTKVLSDVTGIKVGDKLINTPGTAVDSSIVGVDVATKTITIKSEVSYVGAFSSVLASDRPDKLFANIVDTRDITSLRHQVSLTGFNYQQLLEDNFDRLLRGDL